ncbi:hypothetical protein MTO96_019910 [Rhipicephalus appendiculatus]
MAMAGSCVCICGPSRSASRSPPRSPSRGRQGLMGYLCNLMGMGNEAQPTPQPPPVPATDSDTDDDDEYELMRLDRAELDKLCVQMGVKRNADAPGKK